MKFHEPKRIFADGGFKFKKDKRESGRYPPNWWKIRKQVLTEHPLCQPCERNGKLAIALEVDHITPIRNHGDKIDRKNLQSICRECHRKKSAAECQAYSREQLQREAESRLRLPPAP